jgi:hypothetical protein
MALESKDWQELAKVAQESFKDRRALEWKLAFGFWTAGSPDERGKPAPSSGETESSQPVAQAAPLPPDSQTVGADMWYDKLVSAFIATAFGIIGSFIGFACWPALRRWSLRRNLNVMPTQTIPNELWCRVANGSSFTLGKALVYVTINHQLDEIRDPPGGQEAFIHLGRRAPVDQCQVCWAVQEDGKNPLKIDVYAREHQPLCLGTVHSDSIQMFSERAWTPSRVFLARKVYTGRLKVTSADCTAKEFDIRIDPDESPPLTISPAS